MRQLKISVGLLVLASCLITILMQLWYRYTYVKSHHSLIKLKPAATREPVAELPMQHVNLNEVYKDIKRDSDYDDLIAFKPGKTKIISCALFKLLVQNLDTPGCKIPLVAVNYAKEIKKLIGKNKKTCGKRAVFVDKFGTNKVQMSIKNRYMKKYLRKSAHFDCCYQFLMSPSMGSENKAVRYTECLKFKNGAIVDLQSDYIKVKCYEYEKYNKSHEVYDDVYVFTRRIDIPKSNLNNCTDRFNILMIGMDSLSLSNIQQTMPKTVKFFLENFWLSYRAYHKVDDNTLQNLIPLLTGMSFASVHKKCAKRFDDCKDMLIWNKFQEIGYVTAYGEDNSKMSSIFTRDYAFKQPPTHHYMKYFFQKSESSARSQCLTCAGKVSSAKQLLNFALDFANTYRRDNFFGFFRINSYGQNENCGPWNTDTIIENFFNQLTYTGVLVNTFVIFFSEHGIRVGQNRLNVESFYDDRLPILYIWTPHRFKAKYNYSFKAATYNQFRLVVPYDLYNTLKEIRSVSSCASLQTDISPGCPQCGSLFKGVDLNRTCQDVGIHEKWCSCHNLYHLPVEDSEGFRSVTFAVNKVRSRVSIIKTRRCWMCKSLSLQNVHRIHFYYNEDKVSILYVVAFSTKPGNLSYEATVLLRDNVRELVGPISAITPYRATGDCTLSLNDRGFCVCNRTC